uniref:Uncharacterized protein n=1 Tax=Ditylenchus dipsaci TaxID=166011 RepID=A0A915CQN8_9BILA
MCRYVGKILSLPNSRIQSAAEKDVGTPAYLAPEVMSKKGYDRVWTCGALASSSMSLCLAAFRLVIMKIESAVQIIQSLLKIEVSQRLTIKECAEHEWLKDAMLHEAEDSGAKVVQAVT